MTNLLQRLPPDVWRLLGKYVQANNLQVCNLHWQELRRDNPASLALPCNCSGSSTVMYEEDGEPDRLECNKGFDSACHCKRAFYYGHRSNHCDYIIASGQRNWKEACRIFEAAKLAEKSPVQSAFGYWQADYPPNDDPYRFFVEWPHVDELEFPDIDE